MYLHSFDLTRLKDIFEHMCEKEAKRTEILMKGEIGGVEDEKKRQYTFFENPVQSSCLHMNFFGEIPFLFIILDIMTITDVNVHSKG